MPASKLVSLLVTLTEKNGYLERENNRLRKRVASLEAESKSHDAEEKQAAQTDQQIADLQEQCSELRSIAKDQLELITGLKADLDTQTKNRQNTVELVENISSDTHESMRVLSGHIGKGTFKHKCDHHRVCSNIV